jgi:3-oxoacyl-[acyl-carrier protein] reductase
MTTERVVLVTGGSRGIGKAIAQLFAENGDTVALHYHSSTSRAKEALTSLEGSGHRLFKADLSRPKAAEKLVHNVLDSMKRIDVLVNNAGVFDLHKIADVKFNTWVRAWENTIGTNLLGTAHVTYWVVQAMLRQGRGKIINITSRGAFRGEPDAPAYGASKAGMNALSQSLAKALAPRNIMVYAIAPGWIESDMAAPYLEGPGGDDIRNQSPLGRIGKPVEIARTALFLAADQTDFLTGCIIDANGASYLRT